MLLHHVLFMTSTSQVDGPGAFFLYTRPYLSSGTTHFNHTYINIFVNYYDITTELDSCSIVLCKET